MSNMHKQESTHHAQVQASQVEGGAWFVEKRTVVMETSHLGSVSVGNLILQRIYNPDMLNKKNLIKENIYIF